MPVFTRAYRHPGLDDRVVVRLTPADPSGTQSAAGDAAGGDGGGFLGLLPVGAPVEVGVGQHRAMGFPEWVLVRHPSDGHLAMSLVEEMNKVARTVRARAKKARATYESIGARLAGSVPHFLPTFYEEAGRVFLAAGEKAYASQMFVNARKAETAHALPFDEARMDAVFLEFALADAMPTKVLSSYAKGLSSRVRTPPPSGTCAGSSSGSPRTAWPRRARARVICAGWRRPSRARTRSPRRWPTCARCCRCRAPARHRPAGGRPTGPPCSN
ncbi:hypothetical protein SVIOM342S_09826 [Streptomyces violaceorubidus]